MALGTYILHTVGTGDTIQAIGDLYGVKWTELAIVNGLEYPYIDDSIFMTENIDNDQVAKVGSKLVIPTPGIQIPLKSNNSGDELERYALGSDLDIFTVAESPAGLVNLESEGELYHDGNGDVLLCNGIINLRQQLTIRLGTPKGALLLHPTFGSKLLDYVGKRTTQETLIDITLEVQECLTGDFRVDGVTDVSAVFQKGGVYIECVVHPIYPNSIFRLSKTYTK